ncbi:hypothetical protein HAX54_043414 [Datura stramonium]|uniref:Uncharacterized protein n=1 Tax=Datura stramonium TaxID=4076 RepID=A0ABS8SNE4_DATST|nr:hypothetical protein [Datura stramonium]
MRRRAARWFEHVKRKCANASVRRCERLGMLGCGWLNREDMKVGIMIEESQIRNGRALGFNFGTEDRVNCAASRSVLVGMAIAVRASHKTQY